MPITTPLFDLTGHVALITGGNSGIGLGMAEGLAAQGATVAIWGTNPTKNAAAAEQLRGLGGRVLDLVCDVGDQQAVIESMAATVSELGRIDSCFVNAGVGGQAPSFV
ncbi:MAG: SDR family NAD(P)-dependent oxidoreductase, partial [Ilumatobacteraceae bacterium]